MSTVRIDNREGGVRLLTLERPPANAINQSLLTDLSAALDDARTDDAVRALVITGSGKFFCGGFDLAAPDLTGQSIQLLLELYRDTHLQLLTHPKPTIAMVNGHAIAGGVILLLACDYRLGLDGDYQFGLNEVAIGAAFPRTAFEIVRLRLTHTQASELLLRATLHPATEAPRLGVVDDLLPPDTFEATVMQRAAELGAFPREAYAHAKFALLTEMVERVKAETIEEALHAAAVWMTAESRAARAAQREKLGKRTPKG
ncbi:MAG: enoyl-CoA hydratase/isomerase family protein [Dehalococcoidia bacterium]|nr:enoyl-CoA hydratase/isomerase family protein [Dehalococcoidia bacterium]